MNVQPTLITHPKFSVFKRMLGTAEAIEYLVRLWGHCQTGQRGENWGKVSGDYVEAICVWPGEPGKLFGALTQPFCGKPGWVRVKGGGEVVIHNWEEHNKALVAQWNRNPYGRKGKPTTPEQPPVKPRIKPGLTPEQPRSNPIGLDRSGLDRSVDSERARDFPEAVMPSLAEVLAACRASKNSDLEIAEETGRAFWEYYEKTAYPTWTDQGKNRFQWPGKLRDWARKDFQRPGKNGVQDKTRDQLEAELAAERDKGKRDAIKQQLKLIS